MHALAQAAAYNQGDQVPPVAILWPDKEQQWAPLVRELRARLPLLTLGAYAPAERTGPAIYLRCMLDRTLPTDPLPAHAVPVVYLPSVSRQELRAVEEAPQPLQPLAELQYRGVLFTHRNGRDWTVAGFLQSPDGGLGIAVGADEATRKALLRALPVLAHEPLARLRKEAPLRAPFLDALLNPDDVRRLLLWMNDPKGYPERLTPAEWQAFAALCREKYGFDPEADGELVAAGRLGKPKGAWELVWQRFAEAPDAYPNLPLLLRRAKPPAAQQLGLFEKPSPYWPQDSEAAEASLRHALASLRDRPPAEVREELRKLEATHGDRRRWVWAKLGHTRLAQALEHLVQLAEATETSLGGATVAAVAQGYAASGWKADVAVLQALAAVESGEDVAAVEAAILPLYRPWLEAAATAFQHVVLANPAQHYAVSSMERPHPGTCILFCDALRFDVAQRLAAALHERDLDCQIAWRLAALPPLTPTAKPAVAALASAVCGGAPGFTPVVRATGAPVNAANLRDLLQQAGYQTLAGDETGDPAGLAWTELGAIDQYGHAQGCGLARQLEGEIAALERRVAELLAAGWQRVLIVTDHGWLLLPGGLPKVELPQHLTLERKGRCAVLKEGAHTDQATVPWHWGPTVSIAVAAGIGCYEAGKQYEHGGLSPQECVTPTITVSRPASAPDVRIQKVTWRGLRCSITIEGAAPGLAVDIRTKVGDVGTSLIGGPAAVPSNGSASVLVPDDDRTGEAASIVVLDADGTPRAHAPTTIGG